MLAAVDAGLDVPGLAVDGANMRDLIPPGDMHSLLNRLVEAEKAARANLIRPEHCPADGTTTQPCCA